jgi:hypothetical protein
MQKFLLALSFITLVGFTPAAFAGDNTAVAVSGSNSNANANVGNISIASVQAPGNAGGGYCTPTSVSFGVGIGGIGLGGGATLGEHVRCSRREDAKALVSFSHKYTKTALTLMGFTPEVCRAYKLTHVKVAGCN